ncbi:Tryptophan 2,3-dioxygenase, partial [Frankliniella fusca]
VELSSMAQHMVFVEDEKFPGSHFYHIGDGFYYHLHRQEQEMGTMYFRCKLSSCYGRALWKFGSAFEHTQPHNHPPDILFWEIHSARASIIQEAQSRNYRSFSDIIRLEKRRIPDVIVRSHLTSRSLRSAMQRARSDAFPEIPKSLFELSKILEDPVWASLTKIIHSQDSIYLGTAIGTDWSINIVLMSPRGLQLLREAIIVFADGTFFIAPSVEGCYQVFTIVTVHNHTVLPICWCLMQNKSQAGYEAVLSLIRDRLGLWNFSTVVCDFEDAIMNAFRNVFNVDVQGCLYHASDAMARYAREIFGPHVLRSFEVLKSVVRLCCTLPLLPPHLLQSGLNAIGSAAIGLWDFWYNTVRPYLAYVQHSWLDHPNRGLNMSVCGSDHRTNNASESNNRQMRRKFGVHHPNVYHFIRTVVDLEAEVSDDLGTLAM